MPSNPPPAGALDLVRLDGRSWCEVAETAFRELTYPATPPERIREHTRELLRLAEAGDAINEQWRAIEEGNAKPTKRRAAKRKTKGAK